jgi:pimeloyl-ACP methyl ester carboxylesterase
VTTLYVERGGEDGAGGPVLLLLHGMGGTGAAWRGLMDLLPGHWPGGWVVPDLPGHGGSPRLSRYTYGNLAAAVAAALPADRPVHVLGHSLGGVVALTLASGWFGVPVASVVGVGIKVRWTAEELTGAAAVAAKPARAFPTRDEAADRAVKVAGLAGLVEPGSPALERLVVRDADGDAGGRWRPAFDPLAMAVGAPDMAGLLAVAAGRDVRVVLAAGARDPMSPEDHLRALVPAPVILPGLGHSAHVEDPKAVLALI